MKVGGKQPLVYLRGAVEAGRPVPEYSENDPLRPWPALHAAAALAQAAAALLVSTALPPPPPPLPPPLLALLLALPPRLLPEEMSRLTMVGLWWVCGGSVVGLWWICGGFVAGW